MELKPERVEAGYEMKFPYTALAFCFFLSGGGAFGYDIPLGRKNPPDVMLQEGNPLVIPPDFEVMLPEPGLETKTEEERQAYREEVIRILFLEEVEPSEGREADAASE